MKIEHIAIWVKDLEAARQFYMKYFLLTSNEKYENNKKQFSSYFLSGTEGARLELMHMPDILEDKNKNHQLGFNHIAFSVGSRHKVNELTEQLRNDGFNILTEPRTTGDGYYESLVEDIEGNHLEITI